MRAAAKKPAERRLDFADTKIPGLVLYFYARYDIINDVVLNLVVRYAAFLLQSG